MPSIHVVQAVATRHCGEVRVAEPREDLSVAGPAAAILETPAESAAAMLSPISPGRRK